MQQKDQFEYIAYCLMHTLEYRGVPYNVYMYPAAGVFVAWGDYEENCKEYETWAQFQEDMPELAREIIFQAHLHMQETMEHLAEAQASTMMRKTLSERG